MAEAKARVARGLSGALRQTLQDKVKQEFGPDDWEKRIDPRRDRAYWYSPSRRKSVWTNPNRKLKLMLMAVAAFGAAGRTFSKRATADHTEFQDGASRAAAPPLAARASPARCRRVRWQTGCRTTGTSGWTRRATCRTGTRRRGGWRCGTTPTRWWTPSTTGRSARTTTAA